MLRIFILLMLLCCPDAVFAQDTTDIDPQNIKIAQDIVKSFDLKLQLHVVLDNMSKTIVQLVNQANPGQGDKVKDIISDAIEKNMSLHMGEMNENKAKVYAQVFTHNELLKLKDFYNSPLGQKMIKSTPEMMKLSAALDQSVMLSVIHDTNRDVVEQLKKNGMKIPKELGVQ